MDMFKDVNTTKINNSNKKSIRFIEKNLKLDINNLKKYSNWYMINNKICYFKKGKKDIDIFNELLGEELAHYFNNPTVHYEFGTLKNMISIYSENYRLQNYKYINAGHFYVDRFLLPNEIDYKDELLKRIYSYCKDDKNFKDILLELIRVVAQDFYSSQTDRNSNNYDFYINCDNELKQAPLFDYEYSFYYTLPFYENELLSFSLDNSDDIEFIKNDIHIIEQAEKIMDINIKDILDKLVDERKLNVTNEFLSKYINHDKEIKHLIMNKKITSN